MKTASFNRFELELPDQCVTDCHHQGACDEDVEFWFMKLDRDTFPSDDKIREELREYGAWDDDELADTDQNIRRLIWIAAANIQEEEKQDAKEAKL